MSSPPDFNPAHCTYKRPDYVEELRMTWRSPFLYLHVQMNEKRKELLSVDTNLRGALEVLFYGGDTMTLELALPDGDPKEGTRWSVLFYETGRYSASIMLIDRRDRPMHGAEAGEYEIAAT